MLSSNEKIAKGGWLYKCYPYAEVGQVNEIDLKTIYMESVHQANLFVDDLVKFSAACLMHSPPASTQIWSDATNSMMKQTRKLEWEKQVELKYKSYIRHKIVYTSACLPLFYTTPPFPKAIWWEWITWMIHSHTS